MSGAVALNSLRVLYCFMLAVIIFKNPRISKPRHYANEFTSQCYEEPTP